MLIEASAPGLETRSFLGVDMAALSTDEVLIEVQRLARLPQFSFVVTPNVDHFVGLSRNANAPVSDAFRAAYHAAELRLCDSRVVAQLARFCGVILPVHPGSDLTATLFTRIFSSHDRVAIIGGKPDVITRLQQKFPAPHYVQHIPPMAMLTNATAMADAQAFISAAGADYTLFAIGAPQSEILAHRCVQVGTARGVGLCIGASIEFLLGDQARAPLWMQRAGLEWAHRLGSNPRRLARRYLIEGPKIFPLVFKWWYHHKRAHPVSAD